MTRQQRTRTSVALLRGSRLRRCCRRRNVLLTIALAIVAFFCWRNLATLLGGDDVMSIVSTSAWSLYNQAVWLPPPPRPDAAVLQYLQGMEKEQSQPLRLVVVVPGHGDYKRLAQLHASLLALQASTQSTNDIIHFDCLVYVWKERLVERTARTLDFCHVQYSTGLWTHHMLQTEQSNVSRSIVLGETGTTAASHVAILMDDVDVRSVNIPLFLTSMHRANLTVAAPSVPHGEFRSGDARPHCLAHVTGHVDMLFTIFTYKMWQCWLHQINITVNPLGWGYDVAHADLCNTDSDDQHDTTHTGIIDHEVLHHKSATSPGNTRMYSHNEATVQMFDWLELTLGDWVRESMSSPQHNATVRDYKHYASRERSKQYPYCRLLHFIGRYSSNSHDSNIIQALVKANPLQFAATSAVSNPFQNDNAKQQRSIDWVDSIDDWFLIKSHASKNYTNTTATIPSVTSAPATTTTTNVVLTHKWVGVWTQPLYGAAQVPTPSQTNVTTATSTSTITTTTWLQFLDRFKTLAAAAIWGKNTTSTSTTTSATRANGADNLDDDAFGGSSASSSQSGVNNSPASTWSSSLPPTLTESLPNSVAWFVYTKDVARVLTKRLERRQRLIAAATNTIPKVCAVSHPIRPSAATTIATVSANAGDENEDDDMPSTPPSAFLVNNASAFASAALVLLDQPHARLRLLHQIETHRSKIWLVSTLAAADEANAAWDEELQSLDATAAAESPQRDDTVEMINVQGLRSNSDDNVNDSDDSDDEYRALLRQSLVLVDSYAEIGAYTAAIQALEWHIPYILRKLPGHVEYLGHDYPLYYSSLDDVQTLLDDEVQLQQRLMEAYDYLQRQRRELSASHTVDNLAQQVVDGTLEAMSGWAHN